MTKQEFITLMQILKAYYLTWSFDTSNEFLVETWYQYLRSIGFEQLKRVISFYMANNDSAPSSPRDLIRAKIECELKMKVGNDGKANI